MKKVTLQVAGKIKCSSVNGDGLRYSLFLSGCNHKCEGCHSKHTWDSKYGEKEDVVDIFNDIWKNKKYIDGVSISGGDPMMQHNKLIVLLKMLKLFNINVWIWTGNLIYDIKKFEIMRYVDVVIDGKFEVNNPTTKPHRGSDNQIMWIRDGNVWFKEGKK